MMPTGVLSILSLFIAMVVVAHAKDGTSNIGFPTSFVSQLIVPSCDAVSPSTTIATSPSFNHGDPLTELRNVTASQLVLKVEMRICMRASGSQIVTLLQPPSFAEAFEAAVVRTGGACPSISVSRRREDVKKATSSFPSGTGKVLIFCTPSSSSISPDDVVAPTPLISGSGERQLLSVAVTNAAKETVLPGAEATCTIMPLLPKIGMCSTESTGDSTAAAVAARLKGSFALPTPKPFSSILVHGSETSVSIVNVAPSEMSKHVNIEACKVAVGAEDMCVSLSAITHESVSHFSFFTVSVPREEGAVPFNISLMQTTSYGGACLTLVQFAPVLDHEKLYLSQLYPVPVVSSSSVSVSVDQISKVRSSLMAIADGSTNNGIVDMILLYNFSTTSEKTAESPTSAFFVISSSGRAPTCATISLCDTVGTTTTKCVAIQNSSAEVKLLDPKSSIVTIKVKLSGGAEPCSALLFVTLANGDGLMVADPSVTSINTVRPLPAVSSVSTLTVPKTASVSSLLAFVSETGNTIVVSPGQLKLFFGKVTIVSLSDTCQIESGANGKKTQSVEVDASDTFAWEMAVVVTKDTAPITPPSRCDIGIILSSSAVATNMNQLQGTVWLLPLVTTTTTTPPFTGGTLATHITAATKVASTTTTTTTAPPLSPGVNSTTTTIPTSPSNTATKETTPTTKPSTKATTTDVHKTGEASKPTTAASPPQISPDASETTSTTTTPTSPATTATAETTTPTTKPTTTPETTTDVPETEEPSEPSTSTASFSPLRWLSTHFIAVVMLVFFGIVLYCFKDHLVQYLQVNYPGVFGDFHSLDDDDGDGGGGGGSNMGVGVVDEGVMYGGGGHMTSSSTTHSAHTSRGPSPQKKGGGIAIRRVAHNADEDHTAIDMTPMPSLAAAAKSHQDKLKAATASSDEDNDSDFDNFFSKSTNGGGGGVPQPPPPPEPVIIHKPIMRPMAVVPPPPTTTSSSGGVGDGTATTSTTASIAGRPASALRKGGLQLTTASKPQKPTLGKKMASRLPSRLPLGAASSSSTAGGDANFLENFFDSSDATVRPKPALQTGGGPAAPKPAPLPVAPVPTAAAAAGWDDDDDEWDK